LRNRSDHHHLLLLLGLIASVDQQGMRESTGYGSSLAAVADQMQQKFGLKKKQQQN
jgi:hypothetical protein